MQSYICINEAQRKEMLESIGLTDEKELFSAIPENLRKTGLPTLKGPMSELEAKRAFSAMGAMNKPITTSFLGAGAYRHFIPSVVDHLANRSEFYTAYTPYQPEMSQGMLQAIFEYQTLVCRLTGMDAANASHYDGATACAEAALMSRGITRRSEMLVSAALHPHYLEVIKTYTTAAGITLRLIPVKDGATDIEALNTLCSDATAGVILAQPNFFGCIEDVFAASELAHSKGAIFTICALPVAMPVLAATSDYADIAVGEGQSWGIPVSFGGPYLGYMAVKEKYMRSLPGRIVGQTVDHDGRKGYVLTLQAREQHIRRDKAASNICSNQAYCALRAAIHISAMGQEGLTAVAQQSYDNAHYLFERLNSVKGFTSANNTPFFNEFTIKHSGDITAFNNRLLAYGIQGGLDLTQFGKPGYSLWCATELNTMDEIDQLIGMLEAGA